MQLHSQTKHDSAFYGIRKVFGPKIQHTKNSSIYDWVVTQFGLMGFSNEYGTDSWPLNWMKNHIHSIKCSEKWWWNGILENNAEKKNQLNINLSINAIIANYQLFRFWEFIGRIQIKTKNRTKAFEWTL